MVKTYSPTSSPGCKNFVFHILSFCFNIDAWSSGNSEYLNQFKEALYYDVNGEEASATDLCMHLITCPWKFCFAFIPPLGERS